MTEFYDEYSDVFKKINQEYYEQYKETISMSIFLNLVAVYIGKENIDLLNPIRVQQLMDYIKLKHSDIFELKKFNIYMIEKDLEDNILKDSLIISTDYIEKITNIWNEFVEMVNTNKITMWLESVYNIRNPYILNFMPCVGTRIKIPMAHLSNNVKIMYATYNVKNKWCIHRDIGVNPTSGINIQLDRTKQNIVIEVNKTKEYEIECKIIRGVTETSNKEFILKTYNGNFPTSAPGYDVSSCFFIDNAQNGLIKIKDLDTMKKCLNITNKNSVLISPKALNYYGYLLNFTIDPSLINYNDVQVYYSNPCDINKNLIKIYGKNYDCSFDNIKNAQIKSELDMGASFIGGYDNVQDFLNYINKDYELSNLLTYYKAIEIKKNNGNYIINPCDKRVEFYKDIDDGFFYFYYGVSAEEICNNNIFTLHGIKSKDKIKNIKVDAKENEYIYYCSPSEFGDCSFNVNGFYGGFEKIKTIKLSGSKYVYYVYRTINKGLGITTVEIE